MNALLDLVRRHKSGERCGIYAVCSAHPLVLEAALRVALSCGTPVLVEATSNQVNQDGGYTGLRPLQFRDFVMAIAARLGMPAERVLLGGDHLGPNCWQGLPAAEAMARSDTLVAQYVEAGFRKIHLDCSMPCADDPAVLGDDTVAARAARLCQVAEAAWRRVGGEPPVYVVGTEVPVPGGAHEDLAELHVTAPEASARTLQAHRAAFARAGVADAWPRVVALVVQPGVEFDHDKVVEYRPERARALSLSIEREPTLVFEAHSTDYQRPEHLEALVRDHFAILKVGPGATFALRETLWALADIERQWIGPDRWSNFKAVVREVMLSEPGFWQRYYAQGPRLELALQFSLSDRIRYYWPHPRIQAAQERLIANLTASPPPLALLSQYLPRQYAEVRAGRLRNAPLSLLVDGVAQSLRPYALACGAHPIAEDIAA